MMEWRTKRPESDVTAPASRPITGKRAPLLRSLRGPFVVRLLLWLLVLLAFTVSGKVLRLSFNFDVVTKAGRQRFFDARKRLPASLPAADVPTAESATRLHVERILRYLERAEAKEIDPWLRDDIRIAWITVLEASRGNPQPFVDATYRVLGKHPDLIWQAILDRRAALLGRNPDIPDVAVKKPVRRERRTRKRAAAA